MNILIIGLPYHDYTRRIARELELQGHVISVHDIVPPTLGVKALRWLSPRLWQAAIDRHHQRVLAVEVENAYELVLFIHVKQVSLENMRAFKAKFRQARFALYYWDAIRNHDYSAHIPFFDDVFTFDPDDARSLGLHYLPLFCSREFQGLARREQDRNAVYFVGNVVTPRRYRALEAFRRYAGRNSIPLHEFAACTPPAHLALRRAGLEPKGLRSGSIDPPDFIAMMERSVATFDYANHEQTGYTMRVIENLCAGKKIITNNARLLNESFYSHDRIHVFDELDFSGVRNFLGTPLSCPDADFPDFHIQAFVKHILDGTSHPLPAIVAPGNE